MSDGYIGSPTGPYDFASDYVRRLEAPEGCRPRGFVIAWGGMRGSEHDRVRCVTLVVSRNFSRFEQAVGKRSERTTQS